jgi:nicotinamide phosphoribosyltransferase
MIFLCEGMSSVESSIFSGMGHLTSFTGTDTIPAIYTIESSYDANRSYWRSVPATEHSVMCMGTKESDELETFKRLT